MDKSLEMIYIWVNEYFFKDNSGTRKAYRVENRKL